MGCVSMQADISAAVAFVEQQAKQGTRGSLPFFQFDPKSDPRMDPGQMLLHRQNAAQGKLVQAAAHRF